MSKTKGEEMPESSGEEFDKGLREVPAANQESSGTGTQGRALLEDVQAKLEEINRERGQFKEMAQKAQADLTNFRKRVEDERAELYRSVVSRVMTKVLSVLDDLQRALEQAPSGDEDTPWVEGVHLIERRLYSLLESEGVNPVEAEGKPFDPWEHEALMTVESDEYGPGTVASVIRPGYKINGKVLRPAQVAVVREQESDKSGPSGNDKAGDSQ